MMYKCVCGWERGWPGDWGLSANAHLSSFTKYTHARTDYDKRKGTLREWIKQQKAQNPDWQVRCIVVLSVYAYTCR